MTYTPIVRDSQDWDVPVNNAFTSQDSRITAAEGSITANTASIATNAGQISTLQTRDAEFSATESGYKAWSFPAEQVSGTGIGTGNGVITLARVKVPVASSITGIALYINTAGSGLTSGQNFLGLYDNNGTQVGVTADQSANWAGTGWMNAALVGGPFNVSAGYFWIALVSNATTRPLFGKNNNALSSALYNGLLTAANLRFATNGTGTSLPASITPASNTGTNLPLWLALT